jgi:hypothetical protein
MAQTSLNTQRRLALSGRAAYVLGGWLPPFRYIALASFWGRCPARQRAGHDAVRARRGGRACRPPARQRAVCFRTTRTTPRTSQDIVSSARADYARLVGTLYQFGHFAPVVRITLDGREAADCRRFRSRADRAGRDQHRTRPDLHLRHRRDRPLAGGNTDCPTTSARRRGITPVLQRRRQRRDRPLARNRGTRWRRSRARASPRGTATPRWTRASPSRPGPSSASVS